MGAKMKIVVVEDNQAITELIQFHLSQDGHSVELFHSAEACLEKVWRQAPDLFLLDRMLPGISGVELAQKLKVHPVLSQVPFIFLTARASEEDIIQGLGIDGVVDYMTKPFSPKVLRAKVKNIASRIDSASTKPQIKEFGNLSIDFERRRTFVDGKAIDLTKSEFDILNLFLSKPGVVFSRQEIVRAIRGDNVAVTDRAIDFQVLGLRKKLGQAKNLVETIRGVGYRLTDKLPESP